MADEKTYQTAAELWPDLIERAGLTGKRYKWRGRYDQDLITDIKERLFPGSAGKHFLPLLRRSGLSAEALLRAFFATLKPFAQMKLEILEMLTAAGAKHSGDSLKIRFNFDPENKPLDLLLDQFREQMARVEMATIDQPVLEVTYGQLWEAFRNLAGAYDSTLDPAGATPGLRSWFDRYKKRQPFEQLPDDWRTGREDVDERFGRAVALANTLLTAFRRYGETHDTLAQAGTKYDRDHQDATGFTVFQLWIIESDYWPRAVACWLSVCRGYALRGDEPALKAALAKIDEHLPPPAKVERAQDLIRKLDDLLKLPIWQHRHEVYAVWLGALMHRAFVTAGWQVRFHIEDERLEFAFRGVHLATLLAPHDDRMLAWWTELETPCANLPSKVRKQAIKPDYRVRRLPLSSDKTDVLVVEAKQHLGSSDREFTAALYDYAFACPAAGVLLANNGPIDEVVINDVPAPFNSRCTPHQTVHPGNEAAVDGFVARMVEVIGVVDGPTRRAGQAYWAVTVTLAWDDDSDLDLHVREGLDGDLLSYQEPETATMRLHGDTQSGPGSETVTISGKGEYWFSVHRYSGTSTFAEAGARLTISLEGVGRTVHPPPAGTIKVCHHENGTWWHAAKVNIAGRTLEEAGFTSDEPLGSLKGRRDRTIRE